MKDLVPSLNEDCELGCGCLQGFATLRRRHVTGEIQEALRNPPGGRADSNLPSYARVSSSSEGPSPAFTGISAWNLNHNRGPASPSDYFEAALRAAFEGSVASCYN